MSKIKIIIPGESIGLIEEYIGKTGTYENSEGYIRGKYLGLLEIDEIKHEVLVTQVRKLKLINIGDEVLGVIYNISGVFGYVKIEVKNGEPLDRSFTGILYPHRVIKDINNVYRVGDEIFAKVISKKNRAIHLSITDRKYGVINAFCRRCGNRLIRIGDNKLKCTKCGNIEHRKLSVYYSKEVSEWILK